MNELPNGAIIGNYMQDEDGSMIRFVEAHTGFIMEIMAVRRDGDEFFARFWMNEAEGRKFARAMEMTIARAENRKGRRKGR